MSIGSASTASSESPARARKLRRCASLRAARCQPPVMPSCCSSHQLERSHGSSGSNEVRPEEMQQHERWRKKFGPCTPKNAFQNPPAETKTMLCSLQRVAIRSHSEVLRHTSISPCRMNPGYRQLFKSISASNSFWYYTSSEVLRVRVGVRSFVCTT